MQTIKRYKKLKAEIVFVDFLLFDEELTIIHISKALYDLYRKYNRPAITETLEKSTSRLVSNHLHYKVSTTKKSTA